MPQIDRIEFAYPVNCMFQADHEFLYAREPTPRRMPDSSIVSLLYTGGAREPHPDNIVAITRSEDDGVSWTRPQTLWKHPSRCTWGTELFTGGARPFAIFQTFCYETNYAEIRAFMTFTDDSGRSWTPPRSIPGVPANFSVRQGKILSDGSWLFPVYWVENRNNWEDCRDPFVCGVIRSIDGGEHFSLHGAISTPGHAWEPEIVELDPGHLKMWIRYEHDAGVLWESESFDYGLSWTPAKASDIPNPATKFVIYPIRGRHVLINNVCTPERRERDILEAWVSSDGCKSWSKKLPLARLDKGNENTWDGFWDEGAPLPQVAYPHGFADEKEEALYLAVDSVRKFFFLKVPYADLLS